MKISKKGQQENLPILQIIKAASCPTLTGTSELSYRIAVDTEEVLYLKLSSNTGSGHYREQWIAFNNAKTTTPFPLAAQSLTVNPLRQPSKFSVFLPAALPNFGSIEPVTDKLRRVET
ncbi:hypothetical protein [Amphritea sp.]|uniref:hypothetical protein n=1 Tax=Amphritea sp. TaxID=1872502 RepID=UPI0025BB9A69|nr:hypothetical protein [Amphritea sp.]